MAFEWREFLIVAHALHNDQREGAQRTCLGRIYYYVYNLCLRNARARNFKETMPGLHSKLWNWCQQHKDPTVRRMGGLGLRMYVLRKKADYEEAEIQDLIKSTRSNCSSVERKRSKYWSRV